MSNNNDEASDERYSLDYKQETDNEENILDYFKHSSESENRGFQRSLNGSVSEKDIKKKTETKIQNPKKFGIIGMIYKTDNNFIEIKLISDEFYKNNKGKFLIIINNKIYPKNSINIEKNKF